MVVIVGFIEVYMSFSLRLDQTFTSYILHRYSSFLFERTIPMGKKTNEYWFFIRYYLWGFSSIFFVYTYTWCYSFNRWTNHTSTMHTVRHVYIFKKRLYIIIIIIIIILLIFTLTLNADSIDFSSINDICIWYSIWFDRDVYRYRLDWS